MTGQPYDVTIVVPVYNVERFLPETLQSIAAQTAFDRCRVIMVDDGSTDSSETIVKEFADEHPNVLALHQENAGPGTARNLAMDLADTPYIAFCDSDDVLPPQAIEKLLAAIITHQASIAIGDMDTFPKKTAFLWKRYFGKGDRCFDTVADAPDLIFDAGPCHKLYDLAQLRAHGLRFREGVHFEDAFLAVPMLLKAERIALVDQLVYHYRRRETGDSIMDGLFTRPKNYWDHLELVSCLAELRAELDVFRYEALERFLVRSYQGFATRAHAFFGSEDLRTIFDICRDIYRDMEASFLLRWTADTRHRVPYLAFKLDDFDLFARPQEKLRGVVASGGDLYLDYPVPAGLLPLTRISRYDSLVEQVQVSSDGDALVISGRLAVNGLPLVAPSTVDMALRVRGSALTVPAELVHRGDLKSTAPDQEWGGFTARLPVAQLRPGRHELRLVFHTRTGAASRRCRITTAYLRDARTRVVGDRRILPTVSPGDGVALIVRAASGLPNRLRWLKLMARMDLGHIRHRRPFWRYRLLRALTAPLMSRRDIWLVGERRDTAQDNGAHLFRYLRTAQRRRNVYYLLTKGSADPQRIRRLGHVVDHGSWRHKLLVLHAKKLINAYDIDSYMLPPTWHRTSYLRHLNWRIAPSRIFLQHGVSDKDVSGGIHRARTGVDLIVTTSEREAEYAAGRFGYGSAARVLGFPRFDALVPENGNRKLLFMPTWRAYLVVPSYAARAEARQSFAGSTYDRFLRELLGNERLREALIQHGYTFEFLPHYEMRSMVADIVAEQGPFTLVDQTQRTVQDTLRQCDLFVTDWSSTAFDIAYLGTPLVYAQFDPDEYWTGHYRKGYFDTERDGFGPVCTNADQTVEAIVGYLENGCVREPEYTRRAEEFFAYRDRDNCARVAEAIARL